MLVVKVYKCAYDDGEDASVDDGVVFAFFGIILISISSVSPNLSVTGFILDTL